MKYIKFDFKRSVNKLILLTLVSLIVYFILSIFLKNTNLFTITDSLDYILPVIILVVIHYNFKYKKNKEDIRHISTLPINSKKIFKYKYVVSLIQLTFIYIILMISTPILSKLLSIKTPNDISLFTVSLLLKYLVMILVYNFILVLFHPTKRIRRSYINISIGVSVLFFINLLLFYLYKLGSQINLLKSVSNIFSSITLLANSIKSNIINSPSIFYVLTTTVIFCIISIISVPLNFILNKDITIEE